MTDLHCVKCGGSAAINSVEAVGIAVCDRCYNLYQWANVPLTETQMTDDNNILIPASYSFLAEVAPQSDFEIEARLVRDGVPAPLHDGLLRYLRQGIIPGGFLTAILQGDLFKAVVTADRQNLQVIGQIALALVWALPADAFGSRAKVARWAKAARERNPQVLFEPLTLR